MNRSAPVATLVFVFDAQMQGAAARPGELSFA